MLDKNKIKRILVISLSNIGDIVLTFPVLDILKRDFPMAQLDVVVGPKGQSLVEGHPDFGTVFVYHKNQPPWVVLGWLWQLVGQQYDLVIDLRNTMIPFLIFAKSKTPLMFKRPQGLHMRQQHLQRLAAVWDFLVESQKNIALYISQSDQKRAIQFLDFTDGVENYVVIAPGSRAENKRWTEDGFAKLADYFIERYQYKVVLVGDESEMSISVRVKSLMKHQPCDLTGQLTLKELGAILSAARLAVVNDSAPLHMASYLNVPVVAFFGPTDPDRYGPWSLRSCVIRNNAHCLACSGDKKEMHHCMQAISFEDIAGQIDNFLLEISDENKINASA
jgi:ADP-heptose:LPS heptosyltransferase